MPGKMHFLTDEDVRTLKAMKGNLNAGKGVVSKRPTATRRRVVPPLSSGARPIIIKITGSITARSGTTLGSGDAQQVDAADLTDDVGSTITVYNTVTRALSGATETVYCRAVPVLTEAGDVRYFLDTLDPIWFMSYTGFGADKIFYSDGTGSTNLKFGAEECP